jgi:sulfur carrier protein
MISSPSDKRIEVVVNGKSWEIAATMTLVDLLEQLEIPRRGVAVEINGEIVPRARQAEQSLAAGDRLEIVSLVGGG